MHFLIHFSVRFLVGAGNTKETTSAVIVKKKKIKVSICGKSIIIISIIE